MKRIILAVFLTALIGAVTFAQQTATKPADDPTKNLNLVETGAPVPESMRLGFDSIKAVDLQAMLTFLASDLLEGRETGTRGYELACSYAVSLLTQWGVKPAGDMPVQTFSGRMFAEPTAAAKKPERTFLQMVPLKEIKGGTSRLSAEIVSGTNMRRHDFVTGIDFSMQPSFAGKIKAPLVFVGYGITAPEIKYDDYRNLDVKGKFVLIVGDEPGKSNPESPFQKDAKLKAKYGGPAMRRMMMGGAGDRFNRIAHAEKMGAAGVILVTNVLENRDQQVKSSLASRTFNDENPVSNRDSKRFGLLHSSRRMPWESALTVNLSPYAADLLLAENGQTLEKLVRQMDQGVKSASFSVRGTHIDLEMTVDQQLIGATNVLAFIEGSDPKLKEEVIVIGAHLDHLGKYGDYIFNGADDNGSGSVAVMSMARAFAQNPVKPKRSVLFALWTGEEKGLLGSFYYVDNPFFPLGKTVANLNIDMLSRIPDASSLERMARMLNVDVKSDFFKKIRLDHFLSISYAEEMPAIRDAMMQANQFCGLDLQFRPGKVASAGGGSDHAPFGMKNIPWAMYLASMHSDYHTVSDSVGKIDFSYVERMTRLIYLTAFLLAEK